MLISLDCYYSATLLITLVPPAVSQMPGALGPRLISQPESIEHLFVNHQHLVTEHQFDMLHCTRTANCYGLRTLQ